MDAGGMTHLVATGLIAASALVVATNPNLAKQTVPVQRAAACRVDTTHSIVDTRPPTP